VGQVCNLPAEAEFDPDNSSDRWTDKGPYVRQVANLPHKGINRAAKWIISYKERALDNQRMAMYVPYRRLAQVAEWLLLALVLVLHAPGWCGSGWLAEQGPASALLADALPLASLLLIGAWCVLGPGYPWARGGIAAVFFLIIAVAVSSKAQYTWTHSDVLLGLAPLVAFGLATLLRLGGLRARSHDVARLPEGGATFTVRGLMAITTLVAIVIGSLEAARPWLRPYSDIYELELDLADGVSPPPILEATVRAPASAPFRVVQLSILEAHRLGQFRLALSAGLFAAAALLAYAAMLRPGAVWLRLAGLAALVPAAAWYVCHLTDTDFESTITLTLWTATTTALVAGSLVPLRLMGYRFLRSKSSAVEVET
jgi:hypothetical protein